MKQTLFKRKISAADAPATDYWHDIGSKRYAPMLQNILDNAASAENPAATLAKFEAAIAILIADHVGKSAYDAQLKAWRLAKQAKQAIPRRRTKQEMIDEAMAAPFNTAAPGGFVESDPEQAARDAAMLARLTKQRADER